MPLLTLKQVSLAYGHWALLDRADLVVEAGERIGLIGRNGTGKSSLLRLQRGRASRMTARSGGRRACGSRWWNRSRRSTMR